MDGIEYPDYFIEFMKRIEAINRKYEEQIDAIERKYEKLVSVGEESEVKEFVVRDQNDEHSDEELRIESFSPKQNVDPIVYNPVWVEGDGNLVPAIDEEIMEVEDLLECGEMRIVVNTGKIVGCISIEDSHGKHELKILEGNPCALHFQGMQQGFKGMQSGEIWSDFVDSKCNKIDSVRHLFDKMPQSKFGQVSGFFVDDTNIFSPKVCIAWETFAIKDLTKIRGRIHPTDSVRKKWWFTWKFENLIKKLGIISASKTMSGQFFSVKQYNVLGEFLQRPWIVLFLKLGLPRSYQSSYGLKSINVLSGVGVLSTPYAGKEGGWFGFFVLLIFAAISHYTGFLLHRSLSSEAGSETYPNIGQDAFGNMSSIIISLILGTDYLLLLIIERLCIKNSYLVDGSKLTVVSVDKGWPGLKRFVHQCLVIQHYVSSKTKVQGLPMENFFHSGSGGVNFFRLSVRLDINEFSSSKWRGVGYTRFEHVHPVNKGGQKWGVVRGVDAKERIPKVKWINFSPKQGNGFSGEWMEETLSAYEWVEHPNYSYWYGDVFRMFQNKNIDQADKDHENSQIGIDMEAALKEKNCDTDQNEYPDKCYLSSIGNVIGFKDGSVVRGANGLSTKVGPDEIFLIDNYVVLAPILMLFDQNVEKLNQEIIECDKQSSKQQGKLEELHLPQPQHVILPNPIHVPKSKRTKLSLGSLDGVLMGGVDTQLDCGEGNKKELLGIIGAHTTDSYSNYGHSKLKDTKSMQFDAMVNNLGTPESMYEDDPSLGDFDISTLQVIGNEDFPHPNMVAFQVVMQDGPGGTLATVVKYIVDDSLRHVLICKDKHLDCYKRPIIAMDATLGASLHKGKIELLCLVGNLGTPVEEWIVGEKKILIFYPGYGTIM